MRSTNGGRVRTRGIGRLLLGTYEGYRRRAALALLLTFVSSLFEALGLASLLPLIEALAPGEGSSTSFVTDMLETGLSWFGLGLAPLTTVLVISLAFAVKGLMEFAATYVRQSTGERHRVALIDRFFHDYGAADWGYVSRIPVGHALNSLMHETSLANQFLLQGLRAMSDAIYLLVFVAVAFLVSPELTLGSVALVVVAGTVIALTAPRVSRLGTDIVKSNRGLAQHASQFLSGAKTLKAFDSYEAAGELLHGEAQRRADAHIHSKAIGAAVTSGLEFLLVSMTVLLVYLATQVTPGSIAELGVVAAMMYRAAQRARGLQVATELAESLPALESLADSREQLRTNTASRSAQRQHIPSAPISISFDHVSFAYGSDADRPALSDVSFVIDHGQTVGIAGPSGAGKSTVTALLLGLLTPTEGTVRVGGVPLRDLDPSEWRANIGYVPQEPFLIDSTVRANIAFFRDLDDQAVERAAELANAARFVQRLPAGFETPVGDNGVSLSGGERQRICLARALAGSPSLLVLDEATSSLDTEAEQSIREALRSLRKDITIVMVAHRLSTLEDADGILVLENGQLVEQGSRAELISRRGRFDQLLRAQQSDLV